MSFATTVKKRINNVNLHENRADCFISRIIRNNATYDGQMLCLSSENYNIIRIYVIY